MKPEQHASITVSKLRSDKIIDSRVKDFGERCGTFFMLAMEQLGHDVLFRSCATCKHWQEEPSGPIGCRIHRVLPPVKIIVLGCDKFEDKSSASLDDDIPF